MTADEPTNISFLPTSLSKEQFGRRLYKLMIAKGWNQSELGRRADIPRDSISSYVRGRAMPIHQNLLKLAQALGISEEQLLPNRIESAIEADMPEVDVKVSPGDPSRAWLRVNQLVMRETATRIQVLLDEDRAKTVRESRVPALPSPKNEPEG